MGPIYIALYWEDLTEEAKERVSKKLGFADGDCDPYLPIAYIEQNDRKGKWDIPGAGNINKFY